MTETSHERLREIFNAVVTMPPEARSAFLDAQNDLGERTRQQIEDLLAADAGLEGMVTKRATAGDAARGDNDSWIGRRIGSYRIESTLGRGGMGSVFRASRADGDIAQKVAIKVIRPDRLSAAVLGRFRLERQMLALLQHPNIPKMLDVGELPGDQPYIVMELISGQPIDAYARENGLDVRQRLHLFLQICDAVAYAHRNLIVHRDLKPGNVLVDTTGNPQLLDFGIAKPLHSQIGAIEVVDTDHADRFLSPVYAAPEQLRGAAVTTACDIYALGVLLYELLAGTPPLTPDGSTPAQFERLIFEDDPEPPSRRAKMVQSNGSGFRIPADLDAIILKCLRKDPADRYASVDQLVEDIDMFQAGRPVRARRGNLWYRASRFFSRHRLAVSVTAVAVVASATGGALLWRAQRATAIEQTRADDMTRVITHVVLSLDPSNQPERGMSATEMFERIAAQAQSDPAISANSRARILSTVARVVFNLGQPQAAEKILTGIDPDSLDYGQKQEVEMIHARVLIDLARYEEALAGIARASAEAGTDPRHRARWKILQANTYYKQGRSVEALAALDQVPENDIGAEALDESMQLRSSAFWHLRRHDESLAVLNRLLARQRERLGDKAPAVFETLRVRAVLQSYRGNYTELEALGKELVELAERTYGRNSMHYARAIRLPRIAARERGDVATAIEYEKQILDIAVSQTGASSAESARTHLNLASMYEETGNEELALKHYGRASEIGQAIWRPDDDDLLMFRTAFATFLSLTRRSEELQPLLQVALRDVAANPELEQRDLTALLRLAGSVDRFRRDRSPANRREVTHDLRVARERCQQDPQVKGAFDKVAAMANSLGINDES